MCGSLGLPLGGLKFSRSVKSQIAVYSQPIHDKGLATRIAPMPDLNNCLNSTKHTVSSAFVCNTNLFPLDKLKPPNHALKFDGMSFCPSNCFFRFCHLLYLSNYSSLSYRNLARPCVKCFVN